ncbi:hypothetical protein AB0I81_53950 [Nonomuraea sp. NPDC050404]|uniref:hypothetical protein n=1 Tax=Nonomuraea sp. NPDC050404 TaxID=3155783 RepID=UPI0033F57ED6
MRAWFITGASRALSRGDRVVAAARDVAPPADLQARHPGALACVPLDVSDRAAVHEGVERAVAAFRSGSDEHKATTRVKGH